MIGPDVNRQQVPPSDGRHAWENAQVLARVLGSIGLPSAFRVFDDFRARPRVGERKTAAAESFNGTDTVNVLFTLKNGRFTSFEVPGSAPASTAALGINDEGQIVGTYGDAQGDSFGFLRAGGHYQTIDLPPGGGTLATGVNEDGRVVGNYFAGDGTGTHGFALVHGKARIINYPVPMSRTRVRGINDDGVIVGFYSPDGVTIHAFLGNPEE